ncbi:MAG: hypothetical protein P8Y15_16930 [Gemmatimonadales bacterium]
MTEGDADVLIQIPGSDVLWQKEHLLTLALRSVPRECEKIVWLDSDVVFVDDEWPHRAAELLEAVPLVQVFGELREIRAEVRLGQSDVAEIADPASEPSHPPSFSFTHKLLELRSASLENTVASGRRQGPTTRVGTGIGWAFRREVFAGTGFYNGSVIGGNDRAHRGLVRFGFDPWRDVRADENGSLRWCTPKDELHRYVRDWFASRKEDD